MEKLENVPIYRINDYEKSIEFLEKYLKSKKIDTNTLRIEFDVKNELLYFVPFPLFPNDKTNKTRYKLFLAHKDGYRPILDNITFPESIIKELANSQVISQTAEFGNFNAYKVIDKENFISEYINKANAMKIKKDANIYLLKLYTSDYSIIIKQCRYERLPFESVKISDIEKLLANGKIKQVYYNYDLENKTIDVENDKDIAIRTAINYGDVRNKNENLWVARKFLGRDKIISAWGQSKEEALTKLEQAYQSYINSKEQEISREELNVMSDKEEYHQITKRLYRHCIIESNEKEQQDEELEIEE